MTTYMSRDDRRVKLVKDTLRKHSDLSEKVAVNLAGHVLDVLNPIPEKVR